MKVKRIIRKISEGNKKRNLFIPFPFLKRGPAIYYPYLDFQQLSPEKWIEKADVQEVIELRRSFKWSKITKQRIFEEFERVVKPKIIKIQEKIKNGELLKIRWRWSGEWMPKSFRYLYKDALYEFDNNDYTDMERLLLILELDDKERQNFERLKRKFELSQEIEKTPGREVIPEAVRIAVWRRDGGKCVKCGSRKNLEYDHIIPLSKGGSNTVRNIELLCEKCNRKKRDNIE